MKRQMTQIVSTMVAVLFVLSLLPFASTTDDTSALRDAMNMVQLLQQPEKSPHTTFKTIFKNTIISLQAAADMNTINAQQHNENQGDKQLNVSIKLPYLLTKQIHPAPPLIKNHTPVAEHLHPYRSHITAPPSPPPLCV